MTKCFLALLLLVTLGLTGIFLASNASGAWADTNYNYRSWCVIDADWTDGYLKNFPILVSLNASLCANLTSGNDIRFYALDNSTQYYFECENFNYTNATYWVNISNVYDTDDTCFWMYYNYSAATSASTPTNVWSYGYLTVYHMNNTDEDTSIYDSTGHYNSIDKLGAPAINTSLQSVNISTANCTYFDGVDDGYNCGDANQFNTLDFTIECWWLPCQAPAADGRRILGRYDGKGYSLVYTTASTRYLYWECWDGSDGFLISTGSSALLNKPRYINVHRIGSTGLLVIDNALFYKTGNDAAGLGSLISAEPFSIGCYLPGPALYNRQDIDEIRTSLIQRNESWCNTTYYSINNVSSFLTIGARESQPAPSSYPETASFATVYFYPSNWTELSPCDARINISVNMSNGSSYNISVYLKLQNDSDFQELILATNITANTTVVYYFDTFANATLMWYVNTTAFNNESVTAVSEVYYFSTLTSCPSTSSTSTAVGGAIGIIGIIGLFGWILARRRRRY